jgi:hypothetical protein
MQEWNNHPSAGSGQFLLGSTIALHPFLLLSATPYG